MGLVTVCWSTTVDTGQRRLDHLNHCPPPPPVTPHPMDSTSYLIPNTQMLRCTTDG